MSLIKWTVCCLLFNCVAYAEAILWPAELTLTRAIFSDHTLQPFVDLEGFPKLALGDKAENEEHYVLYEPTKRRGYIHTSAFINTLEPFLGQVAIPIHIELKNGAPDRVLLTVSVLQLDKTEYELRTIFQHQFTLRELCGTGGNCSLKQPILTPLFPIENHSAEDNGINVRVEWSRQGMGDVDSSIFQIGDQVRLLQGFN